MHMIILASKIADAAKRLISRPPLATGLSSQSPSVAPSGRVKMNAAQNRECRVRRDERVAEMLREARELAAHGLRAQMIEAVLAANG